MKTYLKLSAALIIFSSLFSYNLFGQTLTGQVIDFDTNETLPFASIQIGKDYGVITNDEGSFEINISRFTHNDSLAISFLGYKTKHIAIKDFPNDPISLVPDASMLSEVFLINKNLNPIEILEKVNENLSANYAGSNRKHTVFERTRNSSKTQNADLHIKKADFVDKKTLNTVNSELNTLSAQSKGNTSTIFYDSYFEALRNEIDSLKIDFKKGTKLINIDKNMSSDQVQAKAFEAIARKLETSNTFKVRSGILPVGDSLDLKKSFITKKENETLSLKYKQRYVSGIFRAFNFNSKTDLDFIKDYNKYNYTLDRAFNYNDELVYVLKFEPKKKGKYSGEIYISADTYAVLKAEYQLAEGKKGKKMNLKMLLGVKFEELNKKGLVIFSKNEEETYSLKYAKTETEQYYYFNRSFTFIENNKSRKDRMKLKLDILAEGVANNETEFLVIETTPISVPVFTSFSQKEEVPVQIIEKFDPQIWTPYTIITPTQAIKDFEN